MFVWTVLALFLNFVRRKKPLTSTRPVGFAAGKNTACIGLNCIKVKSQAKLEENIPDFNQKLYPSAHPGSSKSLVLTIIKGDLGNEFCRGCASE